MKQLLTSLLIVAMLFPNIAFAVDKPFDPNFILSDEQLQYWQSMDASDIQRFLESKNGYIADLVTEDTDGNRKKASEIIYDTAKKYNINPQYIIVKLQKEQSLISTKNPTQKQLDWATGYAVCDSCSMNDPKIQKFKGFGNQVDYSAGIMRWYYDNVDNQTFIKRPGTEYIISGTQVEPASLATGFLYTYTPHIHGNENFWKLWNTWFESRYPNGTLIKGDKSPDVYLLQNNEKRKFKNYTALITRFDPKFIVTVPEAELSGYSTGADIALPNFAVLQEGNNYYLLDYDTLRPFRSASVVKDLGYNPGEIIEVTKRDIANYSLGSTITATTNPLGELVFVPALSLHFFIKDGIYHSILDNRLIPINYAHLSPTQKPLSYIESLKEGPAATIKNGVIFGVEGFNKIYVMENGVKRHIANPEVFEGLGYSWNNIEWVSSFTGQEIPTGDPLTSAPNRRAGDSKAESFDTENVDTPIVNAPTSEIEKTPTETFDPVSLMVRTPKEDTEIIGPTYNTDIDTYLVYDKKTEKIVAGKNIDTIRQPASLQKVLTAYLLDAADINLEKTSVYDSNIHTGIYHRFRIANGERIKNKYLLDSFLVSSLNTPGKILVDKTIGSESTFINQMNSTVADWGLTNTKIVDVTGERVANETTAREYLTIFERGVDNTLVNSYLTKKKYSYTESQDLDNYPDHFDTHSNKLLHDNRTRNYTIGASKTGFLWESGGNLAMSISSKKNNKEFIIITMGNPDFDDRFSDPDKLAEWAVNTF